MTIENADFQTVEDLRRRAEARAQHKGPQLPANPETLNPAEIKQLLHELDVHRIELEMQNEELRQAQAALTASQARYFDIYDLAPVGYCTLSAEGLIREANLSAAALLGLNRSELAQQPFSRFIADADQDLYYRHWRQLWSEKTPRACELRLAKQGQTLNQDLKQNFIWVRLQAALAEEPDGSTVCRCVMSDISERMAVKQLRRDTENRFRSMFLNAPMPYQSLDEQGDFLDVNHALSQALGYSREELIGKNFGDVLHPDSVDHFKQNFPRFKAIGEILGVEFEMVKKDGSTILVFFNGKIQRDDQGKFQRTHCIFQDITAQRQVEGQRRQLQKAESLTRMAGAVAHHYNNLLGAVMGNLEMAMRKQPKGAAEFDGFEYLSEALGATRRAAELGQLMLAYLGQTVVQRTPQNFSEICRKYLAALKAELAPNMDLDTRLPAPDLMLSGNRAQLRQVLKNLLTNAIEALEKKAGTISVRLSVAAVEELPAVNRFPVEFEPQAKAYACLEVSDSDGGIVPDQIEKLFDPFFSTKFSGRGLGLPVVLGIVKSHEGCISVENQPENGAAFRVYLPLTVALDAPLQTKPQAPPHKLAGITVLVVEDEPAVRLMLTKMLDLMGINTITAADGHEALELYGKHRDTIQIVLSDLTMPGMNGWQTIKALRRMRSDLPVVLASGYDYAQVMEGAQDELPQAFLGKPYRMADLKAALEKALRSL